MDMKFLIADGNQKPVEIWLDGEAVGNKTVSAFIAATPNTPAQGFVNLLDYDEKGNVICDTDHWPVLTQRIGVIWWDYIPNVS